MRVLGQSPSEADLQAIVNPLSATNQFIDIYFL